MEIINHTNYPALLFKTVVDNYRLAASAIIRVTYDLNSGKSNISPDQEWKLHTGPWQSEYGPMESDNLFKLGGVDILVFGKAIAPNNIPVRKMEVNVKVENKLSYKILVFGNRIWKKDVLGMSISEPEPFLEMPLTLSNTFGGNAGWDGLKLPFGNNPFGKGFYWEREEAINNVLPNIEDPGNLIRKWSDRPDPVGIINCPANALRMKGNIEYDEKNCEIIKIHARFYNTAFPGMIVPEIHAGERIVIEGMLPHGKFQFEIPNHNICIRVTLGEKTVEKNMEIDQVGVVPGKQQAFITYRFPFTYLFEAKQKRQCELFEIN